MHSAVLQTLSLGWSSHSLSHGLLMISWLSAKIPHLIQVILPGCSMALTLFRALSAGKEMKRINSPPEPQESCKRCRKDQASLLYSTGVTSPLQSLRASSLVNVPAGVGPKSCIVGALSGLFYSVSAVLRFHCLMLII